MDSGNSGSMQSSSGGDEEYDSRGDSISAFFNTPGGLASLSHQYHTRVPSTSLHQNLPAANAASTSSPPLFDPFYVYFDGLARSPPTLTSSSSPLCSLDMPWPPRGIGPSNPSSCTDVAGLMASAPPPRNTTGTAVSFPMGAGRDLFSGGVSPLPSSSLPPLQQQPSSAPPHQNPATAAAGAATAAPPRSSKKRSRASRRASTTVLTTDTSNFRAMVQEFTGLPAPPFSSSHFPRARFDLLHAAASSVMRSSAMSDASPHYLLRPFAQQLPVLSSSSPFSLGSSPAPSFAPSANIPGSTVSSTDQNAATTLVNATTVAATASASLTGAIANTNTTCVTTASAAISTNTASTASYQLPSDHLGLQSQHQSLPSMFDYTSLAQSFPSTKYSSASVPPMVCSKKASPGGSPMGATTAGYTVASGFRHGHADHSRLAATTQSSTEPAGMTSSRGGGSGSDEAAGDDLLRWVGGPAGGSDRGDQFRPAGGSCSGSQRGGRTCKLNYGGTTSSDYHAEKGAENGSSSSTRGEGMVESWICSSD